MFCSGSMPNVSECEFAYLDLVIVRAKERESRRTPLWCVLTQYALLPLVRECKARGCFWRRGCDAPPI